MADTAGARRLKDELSGAYDPEAVPRTQTGLAKRLGVSAPSVHAWVNGDARPKLEHMLELERLYGIPVASWVEPGEGVAP